MGLGSAFAMINSAFGWTAQQDTDSMPPSRICREIMALSEHDKIGIPSQDGILSQWLQWKNTEGRAPEWSVFKPQKHPQLLPHIALYERINGRYRSVLMGETARENFPLNLRGHYIDDVMPANNMTDIQFRFDHALSQESPNYVKKTMCWHSDYKEKVYSALQLPFPQRRNGPDRVISVLAFH